MDPNPQTNTTVVAAPVVQPSQNSIWTGFIPRINKIFLVLSLIMVFGLDLVILIGSPSLIGFWLEMLLALGVFVSFFYLENKVFSKKFADTKTPIDAIIYVGAILRNIAIFLNFIPFIQLLGMGIGMFAGIPYLVIYALLIWLRYRRV